MTSTHLTVGLAGAFFLAVPLPYVLAKAVHQLRVQRAERQVFRVARLLRASTGIQFTKVAGADVLVGNGTMPGVVPASEWSAVRQPLATVLGAAGGAVDADPWGNCYVVNMGARPGGASAMWVLSAGANGIIETAYWQPVDRARPGGDDIGAVVR